MTVSRRCATTALITVLAASVLVYAAPAASAAADRVDLSTVAAIRAYLESNGIDASNALVQEGSSNYAGPNCPGGGWTCAIVPAGRPVIQRASTGANSYDCGLSSCVVVQTGPGANGASCTQRTGVDVTCFITQQTIDQNNTAAVDQNTSTSSGPTQNLKQTVRVHQQIVSGGTGANGSDIKQRVFESVDGVGPITQTQLSSQKTTLDQFTFSGPNSSSLTQYLTQRANASGPSIVQRQNASGSEQYVRSAVKQSSDGGGTNGSTLDVKTDQQAVINPAAGVVEQVQGCEHCGIIATLDQQSSGVSTAVEKLSERQHLFANGATEKHQTQVGPIGPSEGGLTGPVSGIRCCSDQIGNPNNSFVITMDSNQKGESETGQINYIRGRCHTDGTCNVAMSVSQDDATASNSCQGQNCSISITCNEGQQCQTADTAPPDTAITAGPTGVTTSSSATFEFTSTEPGSFICALDEGAWEDCSSPKQYTGLADGQHLFRVSGVDLALNVDPTPAQAVWTIDATPPDTVIDSSPPGTTNERSASITFHATESGATFACSLDAGAWEPCSSPKSYAGLADGSHTARVRATDAAGNTDPTPAAASWTVDGTGPASDFTTQNNATLCGDPPCAGNVFAKDKVTGTASDGGSGIDRVIVTFTPTAGPARSFDATLFCNDAATSCTWEVDVPGVPPGPSRVTQQAFDRVGNEGTPSSINVTVV